MLIFISCCAAAFAALTAAASILAMLGGTGIKERLLIPVACLAVSGGFAYAAVRTAITGYRDAGIDDKAEKLAYAVSFENAPTADNINRDWFEEGPVGAQAAKVADGLYAIRVRVSDGGHQESRGFVVSDGDMTRCRGLLTFSWKSECVRMIESLVPEHRLKERVRAAEQDTATTPATAEKS